MILGLFGKKKPEELKGPKWPWDDAVLTRDQAYKLIQIAVRAEGLDAKPNMPQLPDSLSDKVKTMEQLRFLNNMWDDAVRAAVAERASRRK